MAEAIAEPRYEGKVSAKVRGRAEQVWLLVEDFCSVEKWLPAVATCCKMEGAYAQPGLIRYCKVTQPEGDQTVQNWLHEKLISIDPVQRSLSYEIMENNMGFHSYVATWKIIPINDDQYGCEIEWSFVTGPVDGWKFEDLLIFIESGVTAMAGRMDKVLQSPGCHMCLKKSQILQPNFIHVPQASS